MSKPDALAPSVAVVVANRLAFGPRPETIAALGQRGLAGWLDQQLAPGAEDAKVTRMLADARLHIRYPADERWAAADEDRPIQNLDKPIEALWPLADGKQPFAGPERQMPRLEVVTATVLRAVHSDWQLREVLTDFWHNHFNVNAAGDQAVAAALPVYDREVIRAHALGNFREFLEAVATSTAMLVYLNNRSSRAGIANENYARELLELHGLGRDAYLNALYSRWRDVPGAGKVAPTGYIDQDVYEAARAFTGWTIEDGAGLGGGVNLPATGRFTYIESWHDNYQKRFLAHEFDPFQEPMADGRRVLDLVADHPATARNLCAKLCRRLVGDNPPEALVKAAVETWTEARHRPDQIARVVRTIAIAADFARTPAAKVKRPLELVASFARAAGIDLVVTNGLIGELDGSGQRLFGWPTPNGHPDVNEAWIGAAALRRRWSLLIGLADDAWKTGSLPTGRFGSPLTATAAADGWQTAFGGASDPALTTAILAGMKLAANTPITPGTRDGDARLRRIAAFTAMAPRFQYR